MHDNYKNIEYNPNRKRRILNVFNDMIADLLNNRKFDPIVNESFFSGSKLNLSLVLIIIFYFAVPKNIRLNSMYYCIINIPNKQELQQIGFNHSKDIDFKEFMKLCKKYTTKPYSFLVIDDTLASDNPSRFRKNLLERI